MTDEQALALIHRYLPQKHLNQVQEIVFRASWQGQSYVECAEIYGYRLKIESLKIILNPFISLVRHEKHSVEVSSP